MVSKAKIVHALARVIITATLVTGCILMWTGCSHHCTRAGCFDGVMIEFEQSLTSSSNLSFTIIIDGERPVQCQWTAADMQDNCADYDVLLTVLGTDVISGLDIARRPKTLSILVEQDGTEVLNSTMTPQYSLVEPNGPECDPKCQVAILKL